MTHKYPLIAAGVAAALAGGYVQAAAPTIAQAQSPFASLVISGSSAAKNAILNGIESDVCGGSANALLVSATGGTKNFFAISCNTAVTMTGIPLGSLVTVYYRTEGGSVVGALPIATGVPINRLNLADGSCTGSGLTATCSVTGTTLTNGPNDTWGGAVIKATTDLGVTDVEPGQLTGADYPVGYDKSTTAFGSATTAQMKALTNSRLLQQVFGLAVNVHSAGSGLTAPINLTKQSAANIWTGSYSDWHSVPDALTGQPIAAASAPVTLINREPGSGTRTQANIYFLGYGCSGTTAISGTTGNFSTTDELTQANTTPGAVAYTSIDQLLDPHTGTSFTNLVLATINGVAPSNLAAATGQYDEWFEATWVPNPSTSGVSANLSSFLQSDLPKLANAPQEPDILAIPGVAGNVAAVPLTSNGATGTLAVYINPYTRGGHSCNVPAEQN